MVEELLRIWLGATSLNIAGFPGNYFGHDRKMWCQDGITTQDIPVALEDILDLMKIIIKSSNKSR